MLHHHDEEGSQPGPIEARMMIREITLEELKKLPLRALAAFAARCARRVEALAASPPDDPENNRCGGLVDRAIRFAEEFAQGRPVDGLEPAIRELATIRDSALGSVGRWDAIAAAVAAASTVVTAVNAMGLKADSVEVHLLQPPTHSGPLAELAGVAADLAALNAFTAALDAFDAAGHDEGVIRSAMADYHGLLELNLGRYPEVGKAIDPSAHGPLGSL